MENNIFIEHYSKRLALFHEYFTRAAERQGTENIHKLRVSIKNLKALLTLVEIASDRKFKKKEFFDLLGNLFRRAGRIREAQLNAGFVRRLKKQFLLPYKKHLKQEQQKAVKRFLSEIQAFDHARLAKLNQEVKQINRKIPSLTIITKAKLFVLTKLKKVDMLKNKALDDNILHKIRIHIKAANEVLNVLIEIHPEAAKKELHAELKSLADATGKWHDYKVLADSLKHFSQKSKQEKGIRFLVNHIKRLELHNRETKKNIRSQLKSKVIHQRMKAI